MNLLEVRNLKVHFPVKHGVFSRVNAWVKAVDDVSLTAAPGCILHRATRQEALLVLQFRS